MILMCLAGLFVRDVVFRSATFGPINDLDQNADMPRAWKQHARQGANAVVQSRGKRVCLNAGKRLETEPFPLFN